MQILGWDVATIVEALKIGGPVVVVGGVAYKALVRIHDKFLNREFDQWLVSLTSVSEPDEQGCRRLTLDNIGSPERFDDAVRGRDERAWMKKAANACSWEPQRRFLLANEDHGRAILHVARNALTKYWQTGVLAKSMGYRVSEHLFFFAVTGADAAVGAKKKYRVIVMKARDMEIILSHPRDMWVFDDETHAVRLETCRIMAEAHAAHRGEFAGEPRDPVVAGTIHCDGERHAIVGWLRAYEPIAV